MHKDCRCNELVSATNRVLGEVPLPTPEGLSQLRNAARALGGHLPKVEEWSAERVVAGMVGRRKGRYANAAVELANSPVTRRDALIKAFIKAEKTNPEAKVNPDPRMIQFRGAKYTLRLMQYLKPTEKALYELEGPTGLRMIAKGLNPTQRGEMIWRKYAQFNRPIVYSLDGSRWDKHISREVLQVEHSVYLRMLGNDPELARLLAMQLRNRCVSTTGLKYTADGNRMSGDANTALGNCLLMCIMVRAAMKELGVRRWDIFDDGDDCLLFLDASEEGKLDRLSSVFLSYGQELKLENRSMTMEGIVFCQHRPVCVDGEWRMVQDWVKVLSTRAGGTSHWTNPRLFRGMLHASGLCELALSKGVPVLQSYGAALVRMGDGTIPKAFADDLDVWARATRAGTLDASTRPISMMTRQSFEDAFGVGIAEQVEMERQLDAWGLSPDWQEGHEEFLDGWVQDPTLSEAGQA